MKLTDEQKLLVANAFERLCSIAERLGIINLNGLVKGYAIPNVTAKDIEDAQGNAALIVVFEKYWSKGRKQFQRAWVDEYADSITDSILNFTYDRDSLDDAIHIGGLYLHARCIVQKICSKR